MEWDVLSPKPQAPGNRKKGFLKFASSEAGKGADQDSVGGMQCLPITDLAAGEAQPGPRYLTRTQSKDQGGWEEEPEQPG